MRLSREHRMRFMDGLQRPLVGLFRNDGANRTGNHWLVVRLVGGPTCNATGIGARIEVTAGGRTQVRELRLGSGLSGHQDPPEAHFGLGPAVSVDRLVIRWPDGRRSMDLLEDVAVDQTLTIQQGGAATP